MTPSEKRAEIVRLREEEGWTHRRIAEHFGDAYSSIARQLKSHREGRPTADAPNRYGPRAEILNGALCYAVERAMREQGLNWSTLAERAGQIHTGHGRGDATRIQRALGLKPFSGKNGKQYYQTSLSYDLALRIATAAGLDPVDVGL